MMLKDRIEEYLMKQTEFFSFEEPSEVFTAIHIANAFDVKRNTISHYLNQLVDDNKIIKIKTRPVYFLHKSTFEEEYSPIERNEYSSFNELQNQSRCKVIENDVFSVLIGYNGSLRDSINKIKTAVHYPDNGLPILFSGPTGTGKSLVAQLMYQYCLTKEIITPDAPFIDFNCSQYANNPELLTSNLFGYKKGAFTGADMDREGAFVQADQGILFLDEVHRLPPEGQEKLFTYLDQGIVYPLGETENGQEVSVRLVFATTESLQSHFLETFLRRVPIQVSLPDLKSRRAKEVRTLVLNFLLVETKKLNRTIHISQNALSLLIDYPYTGNVGELKSTIKYTVASCYAKDTHCSDILIGILDLPNNLIKEQRSQPVIYSLKEDDLIIEPSMSLTGLEAYYSHDESELKDIINEVLSYYIGFKNRDLSLDAFESNATKKIEMLLDSFVFTDKNHSPNPFYDYILSGVREVFDYVEQKQNIRFNGNCIYAISQYLYNRQHVTWDQNYYEKTTLTECLQFLKIEKRQTSTFAEGILDILNKKIDIAVENIDLLIFILYLGQMMHKGKERIAKGIIVAHGYSTASSIANVANRLLDMPIYEAFDMPANSTLEEMAEQISRYLREIDTTNGVVLLFDMGSLKQLASYLEDALSSRMIIMNNVSTQMALHTGELIMKSTPFESLLSKVEKANINEYEIIVPCTKAKKAIITTCLTGIGTAIKIQNLLLQCFSVSDKLSEYEVIPYDFNSLTEKGAENSLLTLYDILAVVGTNNPFLHGIPFISLEEIISGIGTETLTGLFSEELMEDEIEKINDAIVQTFSIEKVIESVTILDTQRVMENAGECIRQLELLLMERLSNSKKISLYVHISCLIERLIRNQPIDVYIESDKSIKIESRIIEKTKLALKSLEEIYNIEIPMIEVRYICDIVTGNPAMDFANDEF